MYVYIHTYIYNVLQGVKGDVYVFVCSLSLSLSLFLSLSLSYSCTLFLAIIRLLFKRGLRLGLVIYLSIYLFIYLYLHTHTNDSLSPSLSLCLSHSLMCVCVCVCVSACMLWLMWHEAGGKPDTRLTPPHSHFTRHLRRLHVSATPPLYYTLYSITLSTPLFFHLYHNDKRSSSREERQARPPCFA